MRMSDWSSDVCSSDLLPPLPPRRGTEYAGADRDVRNLHSGEPYMPGSKPLFPRVLVPAALRSPALALALAVATLTLTAGNGTASRSEERRVGKECVSTCSFRGSPSP